MTMVLSSILKPYFYQTIRQLLNVRFHKVCNSGLNNFFGELKKYNKNSKHVESSQVIKVTDTSSVKSIKQNLISKLNFECDEDADPFYSLPPRTLLQIYNCTKHDERMGFCKNRLYYMSSRLKCPSNVLSNSLAKRTFIYNLSFDWLESSLNVLLDMGVSPERIVRDLWVLKYNHKTIHDRLSKVKNLGITHLYPWMVRCTEQILERYIEILQETKNILGENESTQIYLARRLNISPKDVEDICERIPTLKTIRVTKLKSFLDFLISEGFALEDISKKPRVLNASQKTIKQRLERLKTFIDVYSVLVVITKNIRVGFKHHQSYTKSLNHHILKRFMQYSTIAKRKENPLRLTDKMSRKLCLAAAVLLAVICFADAQRRLALPDPRSCANRVRHSTYRDARGVLHSYFFSWEHAPTRNLEVDWLDARNICRRHCMDTVSMETPQENEFIKQRIARGNVRYIWTSGRKCNFAGCDRPDLQPPNVNGWFWSGSGAKIGPTTQRNTGDWSYTGGYGQPQPDNREAAQGNDESCLSILNNFYNDGIKWHDVACHHVKPFVCEDSDELLNFVRSRNPGLRI
ncbi:unnamed protein product, partial [Iphiclides podalirius]